MYVFLSTKIHHCDHLKDFHTCELSIFFRYYDEVIQPINLFACTDDTNHDVKRAERLFKTYKKLEEGH